MAKKISRVKAGVQTRLELRRWQTRLAEKAGRKARRVGGQKRHGHAAPRPSRSKRSIGQSAKVWLDLAVPETLDLVGGHDEVCAFVQQIKASLKAGNNVRLLFDQVQRIRLGALTYMLGQMQKLRFEYGEDRLTGSYPKKAPVERLLSATGFYHLLKVKSRDGDSKQSRQSRYIRFRSDQKINASEITQVRDEILGQDLKMPPLIAKTVFRAVSEAMTNVNHHGYDKKSFRSAQVAGILRGRWWMLATLNLTNNMFKLVFYDAGVGIPSTLPRKYPLELIRQALALLPGFQPDDGQMIAAAMALGRTRTELQNRGKGLLDLAKLIDIVGDGRMRIYSRRGTLTYGAGEQSAMNEHGFLEGTLIEWDLPLHKALNVPLESLKNVADPYD
jgi:hypothetical protein